jgi:hypothetical protein
MDIVVETADLSIRCQDDIFIKFNSKKIKCSCDLAIDNNTIRIPYEGRFVCKFLNYLDEYTIPEEHNEIITLIEIAEFCQLKKSSLPGFGHLIDIIIELHLSKYHRCNLIYNYFDSINQDIYNSETFVLFMKNYLSIEKDKIINFCEKQLSAPSNQENYDDLLPKQKLTPLEINSVIENDLKKVRLCSSCTFASTVEMELIRDVGSMTLEKKYFTDLQVAIMESIK